jgi:hypothetical protein
MATDLKGLSIAQYLDPELRTGQRHEYFRGEAFAMVGGSPGHSLIATNFSARRPSGRAEAPGCVSHRRCTH